MTGWRTLAAVGAALVALHIAAAATGGLLDPEESVAAELARRVATGERGALLPGEPDPLAPLQPPLATWLSAAGIALAGPSSLAARALPALVTAALLFAFFFVLTRVIDVGRALVVLIAALTTPLWASWSGQASSAGMLAASTALAAACLAVMVRQKGEPSPRWVPPLLGAAAGVALLAGGPAGGALVLLLTLGALVVRDDDGEPRPGGGLLPTAAVAVLGAALLWVGTRAGGGGWPSSASLASLACGTPEEGTSLAWSGAALLVIAAVLRAGVFAARTMGLHVSLLVALVVGAPWFVAVLATDGAGPVCDAVAAAIDSETPWAPDVPGLVLPLAYGMYPWLGLLPLAALRLARDGETTDGGARFALPLWAGAALTVLFLGGGEETSLRLAAATAAAAAAGLALTQRMGERADAAERAACLAGAALVALLLRDLRDAPEALGLLALPGGGERFAGLAAGVLPAVYAGALAILGLGLIAVNRAELPAKTPGFLRRIVEGGDRIGLLVATAAAAATTLLVASFGLLPISRGASWDEAFAALDRERGDDEVTVHAWGELGPGAAFHGGHIEEIDRATDLRAALSSPAERRYIVTSTSRYRQLAGMVYRMTGHRVRPVNESRQTHVVVVYEGPAASSVEPPRTVVAAVPRGVRREPARILGGAVRLAGAQHSVERARPGDTISVDLWFQVDRSIDERHDVVIGISREDGERSHAAAHEPSSGVLPTDQWRPGEIVVDRSEVVIPHGTPGGRYRIFVDFVLEGDDPPRRSRGVPIGTFRVEG